MIYKIKPPKREKLRRSQLVYSGMFVLIRKYAIWHIRKILTVEELQQSPIAGGK